MSEGRAFAIHHPDVFMNEITPQFFDKQTHLRSFHRQLSIWVSSYLYFVNLSVGISSYISHTSISLTIPPIPTYLLRGLLVLKLDQQGVVFGFTSSL